MALHIVLGPMFAGKSTHLINTIQSLLVNIIKEEDKKLFLKEKILIINHSIDNRYSNESELCTHDHIKMPCLSLNKLEDIFNDSNDSNDNNDNDDDNNIYNNIDINKIKYIFIDEGQFFSDLYESVKNLLIIYKKTIYISCLDGDYKQEPFHDSRLFDLIPYATSVKKLTARCSNCNNDAPFTKRLVNSGEQILVGGSDSYKPVCLNHL